jgi:hypothetical protein
MTSRNLRDICHAALCCQEGFRCLPVSNGRCYLHFRDTGKRISPTNFALLPASCQRCICTQATKKKLRGSNGPANSSGNNMAEAARPDIDHEASAARSDIDLEASAARSDIDLEASAARPDIDLEISAARASKKMKAG